MAGKTFKNLKEVENYIIQQVNKVLETHVAPTVKDEIESSVIEMQDKYDPTYYIRRSSSNSLNSGGLADKNTMHHNLISSGVLEVTPQADFNYEFAENHGFPSIYGDVDHTRSLVSNIIHGYGDGLQPWNKPRNFIEDARENLRQNKNHIESMKDGLEEIFGVGNVF